MIEDSTHLKENIEKPKEVITTKEKEKHRKHNHSPQGKFGYQPKYISNPVNLKLKHR